MNIYFKEEIIKKMKALILYNNEAFEKEIDVADLKGGYYDYAMYLKWHIHSIKRYLANAKKIENFSFEDYKHIYEYKNNEWWFWEFDFEMWESTQSYRGTPAIIREYRKMVESFEE